MFSESQGGKNRQLGARVETVEIVGGIGLGIAQALRLGQHGLERRAMLFHGGENVIAGPVENAVERDNAVSGNALAQHGVNGNSAGHAGFHGDIGASGDGAFPNFRAARRHQFLVGRDHGFIAGDRGVDDLRRHRGAADQLDNDVQIRAGNQLAPVSGLENRTQRFRDFLLLDLPRTHRFHSQPEAKFEFNLLGVFSQDRHRASADVAEADDANIHLLHIFS